jgi:hypothetical protein
VRNALDVCARARLLDGPNPFPSVFEELNDPHVGPMKKPTTGETGPAEETLESFVHAFLLEHLDEHLDRRIAVDVYRALSAVGTSTRRPRLSVCVGDLMRKVDVDGRGACWVALDGKDGCGLVFKGRSASCPDCQSRQSSREIRQAAEWRQNTRGILEHPVWYPDGTTGVVRIGRCKCGAEFQTTNVRQTRCERCYAGHR